MTDRLNDAGDAVFDGARLTLGLVVAYLVASRLIAGIYTLPVGLSLHVTDVILAMVILSWLVWRMTTPMPFTAGVASALGAALIVAFLIAPFLNASTMSVYELNGAERGLVRGGLYVGLFIASYHLGLSRRRATRLLGVVVAVTVFQSLIAVYEVTTRGPLVILGSLWQTIGLEVDPRGIRVARVALEQRLTGELRVAATSPHPLVLVGLLAVSIGIAIAFYFHTESRRVRMLLLGVIVLQLLAIGATNERTGFVVLAVIMIVVLFTQIPRLPTAFPLLAAVGLGGLAVAVLSPGTPRLILDFITGRTTDHNVTVRLSKYAAFGDLIERRPLIGAGFLTHDPFLVTFDNGFLTILVEFGIIGFALVMGFLVVVAARCFSHLNSAENSDRPILLSAVLAAAALLASMATFDVMSFTQFLPTVLIVMAVGLARADRSRLSLSGT